MEEHKHKKVWVEGPVSPDFIAKSIAAHSSKKDIGAHSIFLGQVRQDHINEQMVTAIEYTAHTDMAELLLHQMREDIFAKYPLTCMHIYHSLGMVEAGQICLFVFTSSAHRQAATDACMEVVERIKKEVPIWGKEIFQDGTHQWKVNQPAT